MNIIKRIRSAIFYSVLYLMLLLAAGAGNLLSACAAESKLVTLDQGQDITIIVGYDTEKPDVAFISPGGDRYEKKEDFDQVEEADKSTYYSIASAKSGDWSIEYEKGKNKEITVDVVPWHKPVTANSLSYEASYSEGDALPYIKGTINASYGGRYYNYIISAAVKDADGNITNIIQIGTGSGSSDDDDEFSVYPDVLPDGEYYLIAEVYAEDSTGTEVHDTIEADKTFVISGNTADGEADCLRVLCNITDSFIDISFDASEKDFRCDEYALIVTQENGDQLAAQSFNDSVFADHVIFDGADGNIIVRINARTRQGNYLTWSRTVIPEMPAAVSIDTPEITNELNAVISFDAGEQSYPSKLIVGDKSKKLMLNGSSKLQVSLEPMAVNEIELQIESDDVTYSVSGRISVDNIPPVIDIYGASGNMTTSEKQIVFVGNTEAAASLLCNGKNIDLGEDGSFTITEDVSDGGNDFRFEAVDAAGNSTVRNIHITKTSETIFKTDTESGGIRILLFTLAGAALFALILGVIAGAVSARRKRRGITSKPFGVIFVTFMSMIASLFAGLGAWQIYAHFKKKDEISGQNLVSLIQSATTSDIASMIRDKGAYLAHSFISFGLALACIAVVIVYTVIKRKIRKEKNKKNQQG